MTTDTTVAVVFPVQTPRGREEEGLGGRTSWKSFFLGTDDGFNSEMGLGQKKPSFPEIIFVVPTFEKHIHTYLVKYSYVDLADLQG